MHFGINIPENPKTIQEKLIWLQFYDKTNYLKPILADKLKVRGYAMEKIGEDICVPLIKIYNSPNDIKFSELPYKFVLKTNHASAQVIICTDKTKISEDQVKSKLKKWLGMPFGINTGEPHYLYIERKCYAEELMSSPGASPIDYRLWMFNGKLGLVTMNSGYGHGRIERYDENFNFIPEWNSTKSGTFKKPSSYQTMVEYAEKLAKPFPFVRVDFFEYNGTPYLVEMTFTPGAMTFHFPNKKLDLFFGNKIKL